MEVEDPWAELGVDLGADAATIKAAWRRLVAKWHPDRNSSPEAHAKIQRINRAYEVLSKDQGTASYGSSSSGSRWRSSRRYDSPFDDEFEDEKADDPAARAQWRRPHGAKHPKPVARKTAVTLEEVITGCQRQFKGKTQDICPHCAGTKRMYSPIIACSVCEGTGRLFRYWGDHGRTCKYCDGTGMAHKACPECSGSGMSQPPREWTFTINIPAGVRPGDVLTVAGRGQRGADGEVAALEIEIEVKSHPLFAFDEQDRLSASVPVDIFTFMARGTIEVPMLGGGTIEFDLSKGTQQVLDGAGVVDRAGVKGPLVLKAVPVPPRALSTLEHQYLREMASGQAQEGYERCTPVADWVRLAATYKAGVATKASTSARSKRHK